MADLLKDAQWVRLAFLVNKDYLDDIDYQNRTFTSASLKFTDTTPGGNIPINPPPQFTRNADLKAPNKYIGKSGGEHPFASEASKGMGRYYSEAIDDNAQVIHMRFGVPQFNSLTTFFTGFYNTGAGQLARTGRATDAFYLLGRAAGFIVSVMTWQLLAVQLIGLVWRFAMSKPSSKFYFLKPTMPLYWNAVTTMVNQICVNRGIIPRFIGDNGIDNASANVSAKRNGFGQDPYNDQYQFDSVARQRFHELLPDVFKDFSSDSGRIDIYAIANRSQRLARQYHMAMISAMDNRAAFNLNDAGVLAIDELSHAVQSVFTQNRKDNGASLEDYLKKWFNLTAASSPKQSDPEKSDTDDSSTEGVNRADTDPGFVKFLTAELDDGGMFASFRVNATGQVNESFSNSVQDSELANKINNMSSSARSTRFDLANGNIDDGAIGTVLGSVIKAAGNVAQGVADQLHVSGLAALGGAAFVDIPKHWQNSMASLPHASYTIELRSPYGNPISQLINIYIPLCMLLASALPLSTGKQSYTSPFLLELYDKGRCQTRLGMIDSLSITRGVGNLGYDNDGHAMGVDVSFSIVDMSSVMHMPIAENFQLLETAAGLVAGGLAGSAAGPGGTVLGAAAGAIAANGTFDDDTVFSDYMAILAGLGMQDQIYTARKLKMNLTKQMVAWQSWSSPSHFASFVGDLFPARLVSTVFKGSVRN
jgi:hypothetical protein